MSHIVPPLASLHINEAQAVSIVRGHDSVENQQNNIAAISDPVVKNATFSGYSMLQSSRCVDANVSATVFKYTGLNETQATPIFRGNGIQSTHKCYVVLHVIHVVQQIKSTDVHYPYLR